MNISDKLPEPIRKNLKSFAYLLIALLIGLGALYGTVKLRNSSKFADGSVASITSKEKLASLSPDEKKTLEAQIAQAENGIKNLPANATKEQRLPLYLKLAGAKYKLGEYFDAASALDKIASENQNTARIWALYTNIYRDMGDTRKALDSSKKAVDLDPENPAYWQQYIQLFGNSDSKALDGIYQEAVTKTNNDIDLVVDYAKFLERIDNKDAAIAQWQNAIAHDSKNKTKYDAEIARLKAS